MSWRDIGSSTVAVAGSALRHLQQEAGDALLRGLDQQQDVLLQPLQLAAGQRPELAGDVVVARGERDDGAALDHEHLAVGDRLGGEGVLVADLEAEHVARQVERADLAAAVVEDLVGAHRAADDLVDVIGRLVLAVDLGVAGERHRRAHQLDRAGESAGCSDGPVARFAPIGCLEEAAVDCGLRQHGSSPPI